MNILIHTKFTVGRVGNPHIRSSNSFQIQSGFYLPIVAAHAYFADQILPVCTTFRLTLFLTTLKPQLLFRDVVQRLFKALSCYNMCILGMRKKEGGGMPLTLGFFMRSVTITSLYKIQCAIENKRCFQPCSVLDHQEKKNTWQENM